MTDLGPTLRTQRLLLRRWTKEDRVPFAALNADPEVMRYFPSALTREQSDAVADRIEAHFQTRGYGMWAVEVVSEGAFAGFVGLNLVQNAAIPVNGSVEVGWRLATPFWGHGYATEAARASLAYAFDTVGCAEVVAYTAEHNRRSRAVMDRIGMVYDASADFDHPAVPPGNPARRHVVYRISREQR